MRLNIIAIGRMKAGPEQSLVSRYLERCRSSGKNLGLQGFEIIQFPESQKATSALRKGDEAKTILAALPRDARLIALDEKGKNQTSARFASSLGQYRDEGIGAVCFVIGGPDGLDNTVRTRANLVLSFSPLTWPHQLVRIMLAEQLYRATTILGGHPYHRV